MDVHLHILELTVLTLIILFLFYMSLHELNILTILLNTQVLDIFHDLFLLIFYQLFSQLHMLLFDPFIIVSGPGRLTSTSTALFGNNSSSFLLYFFNFDI